MTDRIVELRAKLKAREGRPEYRENVKFIRAEIARLEVEAAANKEHPADG